MTTRTSFYLSNTLLIIGLLLVINSSRHFFSINNFQGKAEFIARINNITNNKHQKTTETTINYAIITDGKCLTKPLFNKTCTLRSNVICSNVIRSYPTRIYVNSKQKDNSVLILKFQILRI